MGVTIGVILWTWTFLTSLITPFLEVFGLSYIFFSLWMFAAIFPPYVIRKPGVAFVSSLIAAFIEGLLSKWGLMALLWGATQGLFAELTFALFLYKKWNSKVLFLAILLSSLSGYMIDFFFKKYWLLSPGLLMTHFASLVVSVPIFCLIPTLFLTKRLVTSGLLNSFKIMEDYKA